MLEAAIKLIVERGVPNTTLKDVGELAGFSRGLAGYRFGNRAGLFEFVVRSVGEEWLNELKVVTTDKVGIDAIEAAVNAHRRFCEEAPDHVFAFYALWFESVGPLSELRRVISSIHARRIEDVAHWLREGIDAGQIDRSVDVDAVAGQFSASSVGIVYQWMTDPDDIETVGKLYEDLKTTMKLWLGIDS